MCSGEVLPLIFRIIIIIISLTAMLSTCFFEAGQRRSEGLPVDMVPAPRHALSPVCVCVRVCAVCVRVGGGLGRARGHGGGEGGALK